MMSDELLNDSDPSMVICNCCDFIYDSDEHSECPVCGN